MGDSTALRPFCTPDRVLETASHLPAELRRRIQTTSNDLTAPAFVRTVLRSLLILSEPRCGFGGPISMYAITRDLENENIFLHPRTVKAAIKQLIETHGIAIGATRGAEHGYFFITTDEQAQKAVEPLLSEIRSLAIRVRALSPSTPYIQHLLGQMEVL